MMHSTRRELVAVMLVAVMLVGSLGAGVGTAGCGGRAGPAGGPDDAGATARDAGRRDGGAPADGIVTGRPCDFDGGCGADYTCWFEPPGGYCLSGPPTSCWDSSVCPAGTRCSPLPMSAISGVCLRACTAASDCRPAYRCAIVELFPGEPNSPHSDGTVCWTAPVCTPGMDQTCNDNELVSNLHGYCQPDGTCRCKAEFPMNPATGKCQ